MYKICFKIILFSLCVICSKTIQAQTTTAPGATPSSSPTTKIDGTNLSVPTVLFTPNIVPGLSTNTPGATSPTDKQNDKSKDSAADTTLGGVKASVGKYEEYQSICRDNEFDTVLYLNDEIKKKRSLILTSKLQGLDKKNNFLQYRLLKELYDQKNSTDFLNYLNAFKAESKTNSEKKIVEAFDLLAKNDLKKAEQTLVKLLADEPKNIDAMRLLAFIFKIDKNYYEANTLYVDLAKLTGESTQEYLCEILTLDSQHLEAEKSCKLAHNEQPRNPFPLIYRGISSREKLNYDESITLFEDSIRIKPTEMALTCLGEVFFIKDKMELAESYFQKSLKLNPKSYRAEIGLGWTQIKNKKIDLALATFKRACLLNKIVKVEIKKVYKLLVEEKNKFAPDFIKILDACSI